MRGAVRSIDYKFPVNQIQYQFWFFFVLYNIFPDEMGDAQLVNSAPAYHRQCWFFQSVLVSEYDEIRIPS